MEVLTINYNWRFSQESGEQFHSFTVNKGSVTEIKEHAAQGDGDRWFYDVCFLDGTMLRIFNPNEVVYKPKQ